VPALDPVIDGRPSATSVAAAPELGVEILEELRGDLADRHVTEGRLMYRRPYRS